MTTITDDRLRLIFTCCHPALAIEAQVALTLRTLGGLTTEEIAGVPGARRRRWRNGWCAPRARSARRGDPLSRARSRRSARPARRGAGGRLPHLQRGLCRQRGDALVRRELCAEAIRLHCGSSARFCPRRRWRSNGCWRCSATTRGARRAATTTGSTVLLADQDRAFRTPGQIAEGLAPVRAAPSGAPSGRMCRKPPSPRSTRRRRRPTRRTGRRSSLYGELAQMDDSRSSRSTAPSRSP